MSSILIKGMEMPYCCVVCPFKEMYNDGLLCKATNPHQYIPKFLHKRNEKCPLVEVPTPHGDLIDRDHLLDILDKIILKPDSYVQRCMAMATKEMLIRQTTGIKAEE